MEMIVTGDPQELDFIIRICRDKVRRGLISFSPPADRAALDIKEVMVMDTKNVSVSDTKNVSVRDAKSVTTEDVKVSAKTKRKK